jgi:hypothetical protein
MIIIALGSLSIGIYLRRKIYLREKAVKSIILTLTYQGDMLEKNEVLYKPQMIYKIKTTHHRVQVNEKDLGYVFEACYSEDLISCH